MKTPVIILICILLNVTIGSIAYYLKLPIYLDCIGIMLAAFLIPGNHYYAFLITTIVAVASFLLIGLLINPYQIWFIGTSITDAAFGVFVARSHIMDLITKQPTFITFVKKTCTYGISWGIIAALVSAPIVIYFLQNDTTNGTAIIISDLIHAGYRLPLAALSTGIIAELIDKTLTLACALVIARMVTLRVFVKSLTC